MLRIRPGRLGEALDSSGAAGAEEGGTVDNVGGLLPVLRDNAVGGEAVCGGSQLLQAELLECECRVVMAMAILCEAVCECGMFGVRRPEAGRHPRAPNSH